MADELKETIGVDAELIRGRGGVFDVVADDELIFSKAKTFRFPDPGEITKLLER